MGGLRKLADVYDPDSFSNRMRRRRFLLFQTLFDSLPKPVKLLDVGGTSNFWESMGFADREDVHVTMINMTKEEERHANIVSRVGDATNLEEFADGSFDVAFSNSVIEHLFTLENQFAMAREIQRVAKAYWVQTPNYWFPIEPHFLMPGWQWLPEGVRVAILRRRRCGWVGRCPEIEKARRHVREVRLMTRREMRRAFPDARMVPEKFYGLTKSWIAVGGFPRTVASS